MASCGEEVQGSLISGVESKITLTEWDSSLSVGMGQSHDLKNAGKMKSRLCGHEKLGICRSAWGWLDYRSQIEDAFFRDRKTSLSCRAPSVELSSM